MNDNQITLVHLNMNVFIHQRDEHEKFQYVNNDFRARDQILFATQRNINENH